ncbi:MAG: acyl-CoA dehydrogenase family protein, partial [Actinobacteria bacterium]|nr:acyl-CoA dehydrogenase family protein [Actinomycetota bacterium]
MRNELIKAVVDLSLAEEDQKFSKELREWLAAHLKNLPEQSGDLEEDIALGRQWQAELAADRWVAVSWPKEYGGRSATAFQVALYYHEYARSGAPQPVNRVGINLVGPTLLAHGSEEQRRRWMPPILSAEEL